MLQRFIQRLMVREWMLIAAIIVIVLGLLLLQRWIRPLYEEWTAQRVLVQVRAAELAKLEANLAMRSSVEERFESLGEAAVQQASDEITLSNFLRQIEQQARLPRLHLVSMKPMPVHQESAVSRYPVRLVVAGPLPEVIKFTSSLTHSPTVVGLESFMVRGVQGGHIVECHLSIWMTRLHDLDPQTPR